MQPGEEIMSLLDELDAMIREAKSPFTGGQQKKIIDAAEFLNIIDDIRDMFPQQFSDARRVVSQQNEILERAQQTADAIIADAQQQAIVLAGDQEIVRIAQLQADQVRDQASQYERDTRYNAEEYADTVLAHLEDNLKSLTNSVTRVRQTLNENSGARNSSNNVAW